MVVGKRVAMTLPITTLLTCSNDDCGCQLRIEQPCPHGDVFTCACGHRFVSDPPPSPGADS